MLTKHQRLGGLASFSHKTKVSAGLVPSGAIMEGCTPSLSHCLGDGRLLPVSLYIVLSLPLCPPDPVNLFVQMSPLMRIAAAAVNCELVQLKAQPAVSRGNSTWRSLSKFTGVEVGGYCDCL